VIGPAGKPVKWSVERRGHLVTIRRVKGQVRKLRAHHAVLTAFVGPKPPGLISRHLNDVPADNRLVNLAWGTYKENSEDSARNGGLIRGFSRWTTKLTPEAVAAIKNDTRPSRVVGAEHGVSHTTVLAIRRGRRWRDG
jgi:hypothetical protein